MALPGVPHLTGIFHAGVSHLRPAYLLYRNAAETPHSKFSSATKNTAITRPLCSPRKEERPLRLMVVSTLSRCAFLRAVRHEVVRALSALEANDTWEKPMMRRSYLSEVLLAVGPHYTPVRQSLHRLGRWHAHLGVNGAIERGNVVGFWQQ